MNEIPRVALFADTFHEANGAANFLRRLTDYAKVKNYPFLCVRAGDATRTIKDGSVTFLDIKRSALSIPLDGMLKYDALFWKNRKLIKQTIADFQPQVIHITGINDVSQFGIFYAHTLKIPAVATWHTNTHEYAAERLLTLMPFLNEKTKRKIGKKVERIVMSGLMKIYFAAQMQLAPNEDLVEEIRGLTKRPTFLLRRGVEIDFLTPAKRRRPANDGKFVLGFVGRLRPEKNVRFLAKLGAELERNGIKNYKFLIVGDGGERAFLEKSLKNVEFTGEIRGEAVARAFADMDLFVFPSLTDAFANVVLEAMSAGVPAIAFPIGGPKFLIENNVSGFIAASQTDMILKIIEIIRQPQILPPMRKAARRFAEKHSWDEIFGQTYEYYKKASKYKKNVRAENG